MTGRSDAFHHRRVALGHPPHREEVPDLALLRSLGRHPSAA